MDILIPAKINLHLRVGPARADGFHPLLTWMTTIGLFDEITLKENPTPGEIRLTCTDSSLPCDDRNLVVRAAKLLRENAADSVGIHLTKNIPHGGGLGGGSSNAAFTLMALNRFWKLEKTVEQLSGIAARLGSDIPFFLHGPSSICRGRGELVEPTPPPARAKWAVLILPRISMPTPAVYRQFDADRGGQDVETTPDWNAWAGLSSEDLLDQLVNDLESPAFAIDARLPALQVSLQQTLGRIIRMSGSGSSLFTLYDDQDVATAAALIAGSSFDGQALAVEIAPMLLNSPE